MHSSTTQVRLYQVHLSSYSLSPDLHIQPFSSYGECRTVLHALSCNNWSLVISTTAHIITMASSFQINFKLVTWHSRYMYSLLLLLNLNTSINSFHISTLVCHVTTLIYTTFTSGFRHFNCIQQSLLLVWLCWLFQQSAFHSSWSKQSAHFS